MAAAPRIIEKPMVSREPLPTYQWRELEEAYNKSHVSSRDLELLPFYRFFGENDPAAFRAYRHWAGAMAAMAARGEEPTPFLISNLVFLHYYMIKGYEAGLVHEVELVRNQGVSRAQVQELLSFAWLHAGTSGANAAARALTTYMRDWPDGPSQAVWPQSWLRAGDKLPIAIGLNCAQAGVSLEEEAAIRAWYLRAQGETPHFVDFQLKFTPEAFKAQRLRYETALAGSLPRQIFPLCLLHLGAMLGREEAVRRSAHEARACGVSKAQALLIVSAAQVYLGELNMEPVARAMAGVLDHWP
jgi:hypothetical protein